MILTCPSCGTQYVVKDGAIPPGGRQVRCASCKHSWHQDPERETAVEAPQIEETPAEIHAEAIDEVPEFQTSPELAPSDDLPSRETFEAAAEALPQADDDESFAEATLIEPRSGPELEERAFEESSIESEAFDPDRAEAVDEPLEELPHEVAVETSAESPASDWREPPVAEASDDDFSFFQPQREIEPKRRSPVLIIGGIVLLIVIVAAAFWFLAPTELKARLGVGAMGASPLALVTTHMDRQQLESGNELLTVAGRVINPTTKEQQVPPLRAQLKTRSGKVVYTWTIPPPASSLPAGGSAPFNSAEVSVPPGGDELTITLGAQAS